MFKNILLMALFALTISCGYEAMHSKNKLSNTNFSISKISFEGDREMNIKIQEKLSRYSLSKKERDFIIKITSLAEKNIYAKDSKGNPSIFEINLKVLTLVNIKDGTKTTIPFEKSFKYNTNEDNFELKRYEREIKLNLTKTIINDLVFKLSGL